MSTKTNTGIQSSSIAKSMHSSNKSKKDAKGAKSLLWVVQNPTDTTNDKLELIDRIREGVQKSDWKILIKDIGATEKEFENILPTSISSMQKKTVYDKETSERIYELARLFGLGYEVFDTKEDFKEWLMTASKTLGNKTPFELLDSSLGFEIVRREIISIQHNVYS